MKVLVTSILLCIASGAMAAPPSKSFEFNVDDLKTVDPKLLQYEQVSAGAVPIEAPAAIAVDGEGRVHVAGKSQLLVWNKNMSSATYRELSAPATALAVDADGTIYLGTKDHVVVIPKEGEEISWAELGEGSHITSIVLVDKRVYVADAGQRVIWQFSKEGRMEKRLGGRNSMAGKKGFIVPSANFDIAAAADGSLWIVNPGMHTLLNVDADGKLINSWQKRAMVIEGFSGCCNPCHIAVMKNGSLVTGEKGLMRVKIVSAKDGELESVVAGPHLFEGNQRKSKLGLGSRPGEAEAIADIAVRGETILVLDRNAKVLRVFEKKAKK